MSLEPFKKSRFVGLIGLTLAMPLLFSRDLKKPLVNFDIVQFEKFKTSSPETIFIGNSRLEASIDLPTWNDSHPNSHPYFFIVHDSQSALWYLYLKNFILPLAREGHRFQKIFIFFSTDELAPCHYPPKSVSARQSRAAELASSADEIEYHEMTQPKSWMIRLEQTMKQLFPISFWQDQTRDKIDMLALASMGISAIDVARFKLELNQVFQLSANRTDHRYSSEETIKFSSFDSCLKDSFLSFIENNLEIRKLPISFVRVPIYLEKIPSLNREELLQYEIHLNQYLKEKHFNLIDPLDRIPLNQSHYQGLLHLSDRGKRLFTEKFIQKLKPL